MKRLLLFLLGCVVLAPVYSSARMVDRPEQLHSIQAEFTQETHLKILIKPIISHGFFVFKAPDSLRWEYRDPYRSILLMQNGKIEKFIEKNGRFEQDNSMSAGSMQVVLPEISNWLDGRFSDNQIFTATHTNKYTIVLIPKDQGMRSIVTSIELRLGKQVGVMDSVTIFEGPDAYTKLTFNNIVLNRKIPESSFRKQ